DLLHHWLTSPFVLERSGQCHTREAGIPAVLDDKQTLPRMAPAHQVKLAQLVAHLVMLALLFCHLLDTPLQVPGGSPIYGCCGCGTLGTPTTGGGVATKVGGRLKLFQ